MPPTAPPQQSALVEPSAAQQVAALVELLEQNRFRESAALSANLVTRQPEHPMYWKILGISLLQLGQYQHALPALQQTTALLPDDADAYNNLGIALNQMRRNREAEECYRHALELAPDNTLAHFNLGNLLCEENRLQEAEICYREALRTHPDDAITHNSMGVLLSRLGRYHDAELHYRTAMAIKPDYVEAYCNMGETLQQLRRSREAETSYRQALQLKPGHALTHYNLGILLQHLGRLEEAMESYRQALHFRPKYLAALNNILFLHGYHGLLAPEEYLATARLWEQIALSDQEREIAHKRTFQRPPLANRRLRLGYVSGDFRKHAMSFFIEQLFAHHDPDRIELFAYYTHDQHDDATERIKASVEHWIQADRLDSAELRDRIDSDGIDVLIDLSGYTARNRLATFARRAAPIQAHYLGFMSSIGLTEMDYWIGDAILTPPEHDAQFSETVWRLPRIWLSYSPANGAPDSQWKPDSSGIVWLGSFNNLDKLSPNTLSLCAAVLLALPEGRLLLKTDKLGDPEHRQRILDDMSAHGIPPERIELRDRSITPDWMAHMAYYDRLDIALDPVGPVCGGTTTCDALWMGVPVITLEGNRMASRMSATMLDAVGHPEWIAHSEAEYIAKIVTLARDRELRQTLRQTQRQRMAASPLCDAHGLARALEDAYFGMFEHWQARSTSPV